MVKITSNSHQTRQDRKTLAS